MDKITFPHPVLFTFDLVDGTTGEIIKHDFCHTASVSFDTLRPYLHKYINTLHNTPDLAIQFRVLPVNRNSELYLFDTFGDVVDTSYGDEVLVGNIPCVVIP